VNGEIREKPMGVKEQWIGSQLQAWLAPYLRGKGLGQSLTEAKFALPNAGNNRIPDLAYISYRTWPESEAIPDAPQWEIAPDLAVEVVSPSDSTRDVIDKVAEYFAAGCKAVWIVWPNVQQVYCYSSATSVRIFGRTDTLDGDPVIPGFRLELDKLFPVYGQAPAAP